MSMDMGIEMLLIGLKNKYLTKTNNMEVREVLTPQFPPTHKTNNMEKEFIPYEQALELKELGFDVECLSYWEGESFSHHLATIEGDDYIIPAPLYQQAFRWFREKYDLRIWIESNHGILHFEYVIATTNPNFINKQFNDFSYHKTHEEAELACLKKLIEIVKNKQQ